MSTDEALAFRSPESRQTLDSYYAVIRGTRASAPLKLFLAWWRCDDQRRYPRHDERNILPDELAVWPNADHSLADLDTDDSSERGRYWSQFSTGRKSPPPR